MRVRWLAATAAVLATCLAALACQGLKSAETASADGGSPDASAPNDTGFTIVQVRPDAGSLNAVWGSSPSDVHAVGDDGMMFDWDGAQWTEVTGTTGAKLGGVWGTGPNDVYAVGTLRAGGQGIVLHNDGHGWLQEMQLPTGLVSVWGGDGTVYAGGLDGVVYKKTATKDWYKLVTLEPNPYIANTDYAPILFAMSGNGPDSVLVAGDLDTVYHFRGNSQWVPFYDPVDRTRAYRSVWGPPSTTPKFYIGANYFGVWMFDDGPAFLSLHEERDDAVKQNQYVWGIWGLASDNVIFVGDAGRIMTYDGGPNGLAVRASPTDKALFGVWASSLDDVWIVGEAATILHGHLR